MSTELGAIDISTRLEPMVDLALVDRMQETRMVLNRPRDEGPVLFNDKPWEGFIGYFTVIQDEDIYRLYYRGKATDGPEDTDEVTCYAESTDGHVWTKPELGIVDVGGSRANNVIIGTDAPSVRHNFTPFRDTGPASGEARFKALAGLFDHDQRVCTTHGLLLYGSDDGIHWRQLQEEPVIGQEMRDIVTDTASVPTFWSEPEQLYVCYVRDWVGPPKRAGHAGSIRWIARTTSPDLVHWSSVEKLQYDPVEHLYISQVRPYFRAPHIYVALPARFMKGRQVVTAEEAEQLGVTPDYVEDCSDAVFMTSRGGLTFDRTFKESFIRPGIGANNWVTRTNYPALGIVPTGAHEMSVYLQQDNGQPTGHLRRYSLELDRFASVNAPYDGGEMLTKPLTFDGNRMLLNFSTSSAGSIRVEVQDRAGTPIPGFGLGDAHELVGNHIEKEVAWSGGPDLAQLAGQTVRLRFVMRDADLYALRFRW